MKGFGERVVGAIKEKIIPAGKKEERGSVPIIENVAGGKQDIAPVKRIPNVSSFVFTGADGEMISLDKLRLVYKRLDDLAGNELLKLDNLNLTKDERKEFVENYLQQVRHLRKLVGKGNKGIYRTYGVFEEPLEDLENMAIARIIQ